MGIFSMALHYGLTILCNVQLYISVQPVDMDRAVGMHFVSDRILHCVECKSSLYQNTLYQQ